MTLQSDNTPLHEAAARGHTATSEVLLKAGADVKATDRVRSNMLAAMIWIVYSLALSDILAIRGRVNSFSSAL